MTRSLRVALAVACVAACAVRAGAAPAPKKEDTEVQPIAIVVNGEELARDPAPRVSGYRVLVPVVRIYSALGITVAREGNTLIASAPSKRIALTIGSRRASVDNRVVMLDTPVVEIDGATYVPLRFVADSLGAQVSWEKAGRRVEVVSSIIGRTPGLEQHTAGGSTQVVGTVSAIDLNSAPESVTVRYAQSVRTIAITSDARIAVQDVATRTTTPASLRDVHVGDAVSVVLRADGRVDQVLDQYSSRAGTIAAVSASAFVLQSGYVVTPDKSTDITLNGEPGAIGDLKVGDAVTVRLNPVTGEKRQIIATRVVPSTPAPAGAARIEDFAISAKGPLRANDAFTVTMHGTPGGHATFDIGTYVTGLPIPETAPGTYMTKYTVPDGINFNRTSVYGHLIVGSSDAPRAEAAQLVAVSTTKPQIVNIAPPGGQTVNNNKPSIYATYQTPTDVGINPSAVRIEVNGLDVTAASTRTEQFITYSPGAPLPDGVVNVRVTVADNAGNAQTRAWSFIVRTH
jgi:hypothetical protein